MYQRVKNYATRIEAEIDKKFLESQGFKCLISADDAGGARPDIMMGTGGVWILAEQKDAVPIKKILEEKYKN